MRGNPFAHVRVFHRSKTSLWADPITSQEIRVL